MLFDFSIQTTLVTFQLKQMEFKSGHFVTVYGKTQWVLNHLVIDRNGWISCSIICVLFLSEIWLFIRMVGSWLRDRIRLTWSKQAASRCIPDRVIDPYDSYGECISLIGNIGTMICRPQASSYKGSLWYMILYIRFFVRWFAGG